MTYEAGFFASVLSYLSYMFFFKKSRCLPFFGRILKQNTLLQPVGAFRMTFLPKALWERQLDSCVVGRVQTKQVRVKH